MQRMSRVAKLLVPFIGATAGGVTASYKWVGDRASIRDVREATAPLTSELKDLRATAFRCQVNNTDQQIQINHAYRMLIAAQAELEAHRMYGNKPILIRNGLIDSAKRFYSAEFERQFELRPTDPVEAARRTMLDLWRPDKQ